MNRARLRLNRMQDNARNFRRTLAGRITIGALICILIVFFPYLLAGQLNSMSFLQIPAGFLLAAQICPIILCVIVYLYSRIQEKNDLQMDDET